MNPYFSVITCTKNSEKFLRFNIESVEGQTFRDFEHLFIDGNSTDKTKEIIGKYKKDNKNVRVFYFSPKGITNAMNLGIKFARGKYLIHLNSDDYFYDKKVLESVAKFIRKNDEPDWIYGKINVVDESNRGNSKFPTLKIFQLSRPWLLKYFNYIPHQAVFIKRVVFKKHGRFDEKFKVMPDYEYWLRIGNNTRWIFIDKVISNFRAWEGAGTYGKSFQKLNRDVVLRFHKKYSNPVQHAFYILINIYLTKLYMAIKMLATGRTH